MLNANGRRGAAVPTSPSRMATLIGALHAFVLLSLCAGCAGNNPDPLEKLNRAVYGFNDGLDRFLLKPVSRGYEKITPRPVRNGVTNFFANLAYTNVIFNDLLQGEFGPALGGIGRMGVNTTVGLLGTVDAATNMGLPAHRNDLGLTLGKYGVKPGPYLVLPLLGPSTPRDASDIFSRWLTDPLQLVSMTRENELLIAGARVIDARTRADWSIRLRDMAAIDPYVFTREAYLRYRNSLLNPDEPAPVDEDFYDLPTVPSTQLANEPATQPAAGSRNREPP
jgi:phospholipid-binding lipoprotein MlaA